jgi:hypothetical protein
MVSRQACWYWKTGMVIDGARRCHNCQNLQAFQECPGLRNTFKKDWHRSSSRKAGPRRDQCLPRFFATRINPEISNFKSWASKIRPGVLGCIKAVEELATARIRILVPPKQR